jgi:predicted kinase
MLIIFGGLPGSGKTSLARALAARLSAVHLRIDTIEQALRDAGPKVGKIGGEGYAVAYALAADNLRNGLTVIADSVNPLPVTRDSWLEVASRCSVPSIEIEIICSDVTEHRRRVETRQTDIARLKLPTWHDVEQRDYASWSRPHLVIDTARKTIEASLDEIAAALQRQENQGN